MLDSVQITFDTIHILNDLIILIFLRLIFKGKPIKIHYH